MILVRNILIQTASSLWNPNGDNINNINYTGGSVSIGTTATIHTATQREYKLAVEGDIGARDVFVNMDGWSDFVFRNDYNLLTLSEVENFIAKNGHLPNIPSETEVLKNGVSLGNMQAKLLQKIEELTLYVIQLEKEIDELKK